MQDNEELFNIKKVKNADREMEWLDVTVKLFPYCKNDSGNPTACSCNDKNKDYCTEPEIRVLSILPNATASGSKDSVPMQVSDTFSELASLSQPFYASSAFGLRSEASTKGLTVLFKNLFPPKSVTYQHAYIDSASRFGWNLHNQVENTDSKNPSIMGLHRGAAILQVRKDITAIGVRYCALSKWNKPPNKFNKRFDERTDGICLSFPPPTPDKPKDYDKLIDLDGFPALIGKKEVCSILRVSEEKCGESYNKLIDPNGLYKLETGINSEYLKKSSLMKYLGLEKPKEKKNEN